ncbi:M56 family metallopeptidase [Paenibacillus guangzhouensis]|uniref:M56 family metallopeptidase n=1 Tax=Paenibacillus guangzhouensis TaxID=1473112 RepID=UPI0012669801|nr:M56 family metallopeptidase [Paenibacillus guangzhouensis]
MSPMLYEHVVLFFGWLINGSFMAGILVLLILLLQFLFKNKLEARWKYLLWLPVAIRLLLPWAPESSLSLYNVFSLDSIMPGIHEHMQDPPEKTSVIQELVMGSVMENSGSAARITKIPVSVADASGSKQESNFWNEITSTRLLQVLVLIWLAGVILLVAKTIYDQLRLQHALRTGRRIQTPILSALFRETQQQLGVKRKVQFIASERMPGPAVVGFCKPAVVISPSLMKTLHKDQLQFILAHEFAHIRRWDVAVNWLLHLILILHWFNPLVWLAVHRARQDQEMACDAFALNRMSPQQNNAYGQTIIQVLEHFSGDSRQPGVAGLSATHKQMKRRLIMIKHFNKKSYRLSILGLTIILALGCVTLVNAKEKDAGSQAISASVGNHQSDITSPEEFMGSKVDRELYQQEYEKAAKKAADAAKTLTAEEKAYIENELNRVKELVKETGDTYVIYHKYKDLNSGLDLSFWGPAHEFSSYEDYLQKASTLEGAIMKQPSNLPAGYTFSKAIIEGPTEGKFIDDLRIEGKNSGKPIYVKKMDWKEAATIRLKYTNGEDTMTLSKYMVDADGSKEKGFFDDDLPVHIFPKYMFWQDGGKFGYSISTSSDLSKKQKIEILKAAVEK